MFQKSILVGSIDNAKKLCEVASKFDCDIDLVSGRYSVDAKSIMGIFSIDLSRDVQVCVRTEDISIADKFFNELGNMVK
jgi:phosphotransferase system HPr-like phosphotransfer protein